MQKKTFNGVSMLLLSLDGNFYKIGLNASVQYFLKNVKRRPWLYSELNWVVQYTQRMNVNFTVKQCLFPFLQALQSVQSDNKRHNYVFVKR